MKYAKIVDGEVQEMPLPQTGFLSDGRSVSGYDLLPIEELRHEGWYPVIEEKPEYNPLTQVLQFEQYVVETDFVTAKYIVTDLPV